MKLPVGEARAVFRTTGQAALGTLSARHDGAPFVSHVLFILDEHAYPVLLLSDLAEHTRNVVADARASLMAHGAHADPQQIPRVTLQGELRRIERSDALAARYLRYHPEAGASLALGDFNFYRMQPSHIRLIGGFARAGWLDAEAWPMADFGEAGLIAARQQLADLIAPDHVLGLDPEGLDLMTPAGRERLGLDAAAGSLSSAIASARDALTLIRAN